jgi:hypothetical protein
MAGFVRAAQAGRLAIVSLVVLTLLGACTAARESPAQPSARPVTTAQAERLAAIRYKDYNRGVIPVRLALHVGDQDLAIAGDVDMRKQIGYATFGATGAESSAGLMQWTMKAIALLPNGATSMTIPPPQDGWTTRPLDPSASRLDAALAIVLDLSADRPENPLLLRQNGAAYLRTETLRGHTVDVFRGPSVRSESPSSGTPSRLTYFVDRSAILHRVVVDLAGGGGPLTIDLLDGRGGKIILIPALG